MKIEIDIPEQFAAFCRVQGLSPAVVLQAFVHDLAATERSNGSDERMRAGLWFDRVDWDSKRPSYTLEQRPAELGGGWHVKLWRADGEAGGGAVFPLDPDDPDYTDQDAHDDAELHGEEWILRETAGHAA